jgi:ABC-type glycerol-3-phosphate transport system substrate-binding protein
MRGRFLFLIFACALLSLAARSASAADWQERWKESVAAAKEEGAVTVATSPNLLRRDFLLQQWQKDFPDIKLSLTTVRGSSFVPTVATERSAGKFLWDVFQSGPTTAIEAARQGFFDPLQPELILPEVNDPAVWGGWNDAFYDPEKKYVIGLVSDVAAPYYNASLVPPAKVASLGLKILLEPEYKDKIVWYDPRLEGPGSLFLPLLQRVLGSDGLRRLIVDQNPIFVDNLHAAAEAVVRRKALFALSGHADEDLKEFVQAGLSPDVRSFGPSPATAYRSTDGSALALFNHRPHPAAARLFANWYMTKAVSEGVSRATFFDSRRTDLASIDPSNAAQPGGDYVDPQRDAGLETLRQWRIESKKLRPQ